MAIGALLPEQVGKGSQRVNESHRVMAPIQGIDTRVSVSVGAPLHCIYTYNLVPYDYGMRVRPGYREWALNLDLGTSTGVHTIIPFEGIIETGAGDKLFAATSEGIWDVSDAGAAPTLVATFFDNSADAGYGVYTHYVDGSGDDLLYYADSVNGLAEYDPVADTWNPAGGITGPDTTIVNYVVSHKQRIWLIERESQSAWYLPVGSNSGIGTEFTFASKFKHGGALVGLLNWAVDGGNGVDDYLVAVSRSGDILPFQGIDPSSADTWNLTGTYYVGKIPKGPNFATGDGGEVYILSAYGVIGMGELLKGVDTASVALQTEDTNMSSKIASLLRGRLKESIDLHGWAIRTVPSEGSILIDTPKILSRRNEQFAYNISTRAWGLWRDVPMTCFDSYKGAIAFGTEDNRILYMDASSDNVLLTPPVGRANGDAITFSVLTSFSPLEMPGTYKRIAFIRPDFIAAAPPTFDCEARYDYDISEVPPRATDVQEQAKWDEGVWDVARWSTEQLAGINALRGSWGRGRYVAIAMGGSTRTDTRFAGWDIIFDSGGLTL